MWIVFHVVEVQPVASKVFEDFENEDGSITRYRKHLNGRGRVAAGATVDPSAFIDATAYVEEGAEVARAVTIGPGSWVDRNAIVGAGTKIGAAVRIGSDAVLGSAVMVGSHTRIGAAAKIANGTKLGEDTVVPAGAVVRGRMGYQRAA